MRKLQTFTWTLLIALAGSMLAQAPPKDDSKKSASAGHASARHGRVPHTGSWLRRYQNMPADQQQQALNNDPQFQNLPPDRQQTLRQRLQEFNNLPADKKQRILKRMEVFDHLSPEQQQKARDLYGRLRTMPEPRRRIIKQTAHNLRQFDAAERERLLSSEPYVNNFSDNERSLIRDLASLDVGPAVAEHQAEGSPKQNSNPN